MRIPRIYHPELITAGREIALSDDAANHVGRVLRMGAGQQYNCSTALTVFSTRKSRGRIKSVHVNVLRGEVDDRESPLHIHLGGDVARRENGVHDSEIH